MIQNKQTLVAKISSKGNLKGSLNNAVVKEYPKLENLEVTPSGEQQVFKSEKYGYDTVKVKAVESEELHIMPSTEEQSYSGMYNKVIVAGDSNLVSENIPEDKEIFGVKGTAKLGGEENAIMEVGTYKPNKDKLNDYILQKMLKKMPQVDTSTWETTSYMFNNCESLTEIPLLDTSNVTNMAYMFYNCVSLKEVPLLNTSKLTNMNYMFGGCTSLTKIPLLDTSNVTNTGNMFDGCTSLTEIPLLDTSNVTDMNYMFSNCKSLTKIPLLDTRNVDTMNYMFSRCSSLMSVPQLDTSNSTNIANMFYSCAEVTNLGGFKDLGKSYTQASTNYYRYKLSLSMLKNLTHESLMNVINGLYDLNLAYNVASGGTLYRQSLELGSTNLAKLTAEEIAIATNKGWNVT